MKNFASTKKYFKIALVGIIAMFILASCGEFGNKTPEEIHTHSFTVQSSGVLKCTGCNEKVERNYIAIVDENNVAQIYSKLSSSNGSIGLTVDGTKIEYTNTSGSAKKVVIYTTSGQDLTINAPNDDITHFGEVKSVDIVAVADNSYHGKASVEETITVAKGNIELEVSVPEVKVEATGSVSVNLGKDAKVESLSVETKEGTALQTVKVGGSGKVEKLETKTPVAIETKVEEVEVKSEDVSITVSGNAEVTEVKVDKTVNFTSEKKFKINIAGNAKVEGVVGVESTALETKAEPGTEPVHIHTWDNGKETTKATCTTDGVKTYACTDDSCKETKTEVIKALGHDLESHKAQAPTCTEVGWDSYDTCKRDGCTYTTYLEKKAQGHNYGEPVWAWSSDNSTVTAKFTCANDSKHVETINASVSSKETLAPTCTAKGNTKYTAVVSFNGKTYTTEKDVETKTLNHDLEHHEAQKPTCTEKGWDAYDTCKREGCTYTTYVEKKSLGHDYKATVIPPTSEAEGYTSYECSRCHDTYKDNYVPSLGHVFGSPVWTWSKDNSTATAKFTCTTEIGHVVEKAGNITTTVLKAVTCTEDGTTQYTAKITFNETEYSDTKTVTVTKLGHDIEHHDAKDPTCTEVGWDAYDTCKRDGCTYTTYVDKPALGHNYGEPVWTWSKDYSTATAKFTCSNDSKHVETKNASVSSKVTLEPTCTTKGNTKYTAVVSFNGKTYTAEKDVEIAAFGHDYATATYQWSDGYKCTATRVCTHDSNHKETETVQGVYEEIKPATCSEKGSGKYTATFTNGAFTQQVQNVELAKIAHKFNQEVVNAKYLKSAATCESKAIYYKSCECGEASTTETFEYGEPIEHSFDDYGVCIACGYNKNEQYLLIDECGVLYGTTQRIVGGLTIPEGVTAINSGEYDEQGNYKPGVFEESYEDNGYLTAVKLPSTLTYIGWDSFSFCTGLTSVVIPGNVKEISDYAFEACFGLTKVELQDGIETIGGEGAFCACDSLTEVILPNSLKTIGMSAFYECMNLKTVFIPDSVTTIGESAFGTCTSLEAITIPSSVTSIGDWAFEDTTSLTTITISADADSISGAPWGAPNVEYIIWNDCKDEIIHDEQGKITYIVRYDNNSKRLKETKYYSYGFVEESGYEIKPEYIAVYNENGQVSSKTEFDENGNETHYLESLYSGEGQTTNIYTSSDKEVLICVVQFDTNGTKLYETYFDENGKITHHDIYNSVYKNGYARLLISDGVITSCSEPIVGILTIPEGVTEIDYIKREDGRFDAGIFEYNTELTAVKLPNTLTRIGMDAFAGCTGLKTVVIPSNVTSIELEAFACTCLEEITFLGDKVIFDEDVFAECYTLKDSIIYNNWLIKAKDTDGRFVVQDGITKIWDYAFNECENVDEIILPNTVVSIGRHAFADCTGLRSITIPEGVTSIGDYAFYRCTGLTSITIPNSVTSIGYSAFAGCSGLTSITIPDGVTRIGDYAFSGCTGLTSITILEGVTSIGDWAFSDCTGLTSITIEKTKNSISGAPWGAPNTTKITWSGEESEPSSKTVFYSMMTYNYYEEVSCILSVDSPEDNKGQFNLEMYGQKVSGNYEITPDGITASWYEGPEYLVTGKIQKNRNEQFSSFDEFKSAATCYIFTGYTSDEGWEESDTTHWVSANCTCKSVKIYDMEGKPWGEGDYAAFQVPANSSIDSQMACMGDPETDRYKFYTDVDCTNLFDLSTKITTDIVLYCQKESSEQPATHDHSFDNYGVCTECGYNKNLQYLIIENGEVKGTTQKIVGGLTIPDNVVIMDYDSVPGCASVRSERVFSIGEEAFSGCIGLTSIVIPDSVTSIGSNAFYGCSGLTSITTPFIGKSQSSHTYLGYLFGAISSLLNSEYIPSSLKIVTVTTSIGNDAFYDCTGLTSITVSDGVTSIGDYAFRGCTGLPSITIPSSVISIGSSVFSGWTSDQIITVKSGFSSGCDNDAWCDCEAKIIIDLGNNVTSIGDYAFYNFEDLTSITIPDSVTSIGDCAFYGCTGLKSITIPESVRCIGDYAFYGWTSDQVITVKSGFGTGHYDYSWSYYTWNKCDAKVIADLGIDVTSIGHFAFSDCTGLTSITIPDSVTSIGSSAFEGCTGLTSITIPDSVKSIGNFAFSGCTGLTSITIPDSVTSIGDLAFDGCTGLTSITIPDSVTSIGDFAFDGCTGLTSITIPDSVTSIGESAFYRCKGLTSIVIPDSVTSIGDCAFSGCTGLTSITIDKIKDSISGAPWGASSTTEVIWTVHTHDYSQEVVDSKYLKSAATCTSKAVYYKSCSCGEAGTDAFEFGNILEHNCNSYGICTVCGLNVFLPRKFTIDSTGSQVLFSSGNLWYNTSTETWSFEENQLDYQTEWDENHIDKFYWSNDFSLATAQKYSDSKRQTSDVFFATKNFTVNGYSNWETLSYSEWYYLLFRRSTNVSGVDMSDARYARVMVNDVKGLIIFPDIFTWDPNTMGIKPTYINSSEFIDENWSVWARNYTITQFEKMEEAGIVFLPYAGQRMSDGIFSSGQYWTSTPDAGDASIADYVYFSCYGTGVADKGLSHNRDRGSSVRLVTRVESTEHIHAYNKEVVGSMYLKSTATCTRSAVYFKSCICGEIGTETFKYGEPIGHKYGLDGNCIVCSDKKASDVILNGSFTVSSTGNRVKFATGNLWYNTSTGSWDCENSQLDYQKSWDANHIDKFYWSNDVLIAIAQTYSDLNRSKNDKFFAADNFTVNDYSEWKTLSFYEWDYLLNTRSTNVMGVDASNARYARVTVDGIKGLMLFPDIFIWNTSTMGSAPALINDTSAISENWLEATSYTLSQFEKMEEAGIVFLPCAGYRMGSSFDVVGAFGHYWSSTPKSGDADYVQGRGFVYDFAGGLGITCYGLGIELYNSRSYGNAIRLVTYVE